MIGSVTKRMLKGTRLKEGAFAEKEDLTEIVLPDEIEDIGEVAFFGCTNLRHIKLPENLKTIREEAFGESGLESV
ncbi:MAG: leucine-rich repeat domain-containing protein, partial [Oscillospiraceae bacterium]|nr:leucine-rich repeat domain-containing protein [Oscillospiraceae bacterium]